MTACSLDANLFSEVKDSSSKEPLESLVTPQISAGASHTCLLKSDGTVWCWGDNTRGQLGNGNNTSSSIPVQVSDAGVQYKSISVSDNMSCGVTISGAARCWGLVENSNVPVPISGLSSGVSSISVAGEKWGSYGYACAVLDSGEVKCWGYHVTNIGDGSSSSATPVTFVGLSNVKQISAGRGHTCALLNSGEVTCWGANSSGQLGDGTMTHSSILVAVSGLTNVQKISVASSSWTNDGGSCALLTNGTVKCWGNNHYGSLGNNDLTGTGSTIPVDVFGLNNITDIFFSYGNDSNGRGVGCAISNSGTLSCWGANTTGMIGDGTTTSRFAPVHVPGLSEVTVGVALGEAGDNGAGHSCALDITGNYKCWGKNSSGQLGDGTTIDRLSP